MIKAMTFICCAASVHSLATPVGSLLSGPLLDAIGRRGSLQLSAIPLCVGWLIIGFSRSVITILIGRVVCGLSVGLMSVPAQVQYSTIVLMMIYTQTELYRNKFLPNHS